MKSPGRLKLRIILPTVALIFFCLYKAWQFVYLNDALVSAVGTRVHGDIGRLLFYGADPNASFGDNNQFPLERAASSGDPISLKMLLDAGADPCAKNGAGGTAFSYAKIKSIKESLRTAMIERGCSP